VSGLTGGQRCAVGPGLAPRLALTDRHRYVTAVPALPIHLGLLQLILARVS
jgi:hypothetical protein